jgi:hypothetical protein
MTVLVLTKRLPYLTNDGCRCHSRSSLQWTEFLYQLLANLSFASVLYPFLATESHPGTTDTRNESWNTQTRAKCRPNEQRLARSWVNRWQSPLHATSPLSRGRYKVYRKQTIAGWRIGRETKLIRELCKRLTAYNVGITRVQTGLWFGAEK